jgi:hypothetical protein
MEFTKLPPAPGVTDPLSVQVAPAASEPPVTVSEVAVKLADPPQLVDALVAVSPDGRGSVRAKPDSAVAPLFLSVTVRVEVPPAATVAGEKALVTDAPLMTVRVAVAAAKLTPPIVPAVIVLV